jgi:uncharacterized membrane protein (DUF4010 family)
MAASSWNTYLASKKLLQEHGSVAGVKAAAASSAAVTAPLTVGLDAWKDLPAAVAAAASQVDIVIPVRAWGEAPAAVPQLYLDLPGCAAPWPRTVTPPS